MRSCRIAIAVAIDHLRRLRRVRLWTAKRQSRGDRHHPPTATTGTKQGLPIFQGISGQNAGAKHISMNKVIIPPGGAAKAHVHKGYELVIYLIKGRVKTLYGEGLKKSVINEAGDFLYIPADLPHKPINLCTTEAAEAIVARTDPNEQESVEHVAEPDADHAHDAKK